MITRFLTSASCWSSCLCLRESAAVRDLEDLDLDIRERQGHRSGPSAIHKLDRQVNGLQYSSRNNHLNRQTSRLLDYLVAPL